MPGLSSWELVKVPVSHLWTHLPHTIRRKELTLKFCSWKRHLSISKPQLKLDFIFPFQFLKAISTPAVKPVYQRYEVSHQLGLKYSSISSY